MIFEDHRPALLGVAAAVGTPVVHAVIGDPYATLEAIRVWLAIGGQLVAIMAGTASFIWYAYNFINRNKKKD